eukprot:g12117.t1
MWHPIRHRIADPRIVLPKVAPEVYKSNPMFTEGLRVRNYFCTGLLLFLVTQFTVVVFHTGNVLELGKVVGEGGLGGASSSAAGAVFRGDGVVGVSTSEPGSDIAAAGIRAAQNVVQVGEWHVPREIFLPVQLVARAVEGVAGVFFTSLLSGGKEAVRAAGDYSEDVRTYLSGDEAYQSGERWLDRDAAISAENNNSRRANFSDGGSLVVAFLLLEVVLMGSYLYYLQFCTSDDEDVCPLSVVFVFAVTLGIVCGAFVYSGFYVHYDLYLHGNTVHRAQANESFSGAGGFVHELQFVHAQVDPFLSTAWLDERGTRQPVYFWAVGKDCCSLPDRENLQNANISRMPYFACTAGIYGDNGVVIVNHQQQRRLLSPEAGGFSSVAGRGDQGGTRTAYSYGVVEPTFLLPEMRKRLFLGDWLHPRWGALSASLSATSGGPAEESRTNQQSSRRSGAGADESDDGGGAEATRPPGPFLALDGPSQDAEFSPQALAALAKELTANRHDEIYVDDLALELNKWHRARELAEHRFGLQSSTQSSMYIHYLPNERDILNAARLLAGGGSVREEDRLATGLLPASPADLYARAYRWRALQVSFLITMFLFVPLMGIVAYVLAKLATQDAFEERAEEVAAGAVGAPGGKGGTAGEGGEQEMVGDTWGENESDSFFSSEEASLLSV